MAWGNKEAQVKGMGYRRAFSCLSFPLFIRLKKTGESKQRPDKNFTCMKWKLSQRLKMTNGYDIFETLPRDDLIKVDDDDDDDGGWYS